MSFISHLFLFQGFPQHSVQHTGKQSDEEERVGEEEREQVEGFHQEKLRASHQLSEPTGETKTRVEPPDGALSLPTNIR
jgi:hypothetical protein